MQDYGAVARSYDRMHRTWLRHAGGTAQIAFEAAVLAELRPGDRVLDAGAGTGALARRILASVPVGGVELTLFDKSAAMLAQAKDIACPQVVGCLMDMPFEENRFDLVCAAWSFEACEVPHRAIREALRVLKPGGTLVSVFCSDAKPCSWVARMMRFGVERRGLGRFLRAGGIAGAMRAFGACEVIPLRSEGPATVLLARKGHDVMAERQQSKRLHAPARWPALRDRHGLPVIG